MAKIVTIKLSDEEHRRFVDACKKAGTHRGFFAKNAIMGKVDECNDKK